MDASVSIHGDLQKQLLAMRNQQGFWEGHLSSSALSTATAVFALALVDRDGHRDTIARGLAWLSRHQNTDGGWGDTPESPSNLSTTLLCYSALSVTTDHRDTVRACQSYLTQQVGSLAPPAITRAVETAYGRDKTFSIPILTMCALAGKLGNDGWSRIRALPFELAALPRRLFAWLRLPVVSYALPALIAVGQVRFHHDPPPPWPIRSIRRRVRQRTLELLSRLQPENGGFLEAAPLTGFVTMSLAGCGHTDHPVVAQAVRFLTETVRSDGSWPIDTNLATWITTQTVSALAAKGDLHSTLPTTACDGLVSWLLNQQHRHVHPFTNAAPGAWAWSDRPGAVPDADDTAGALIALHRLDPHGVRVQPAATAGSQWLIDVQNRDGGIPTFCRGWTRLPFDRSCPDITAHAIAAWTCWQDQLSGELQRRISRARQRALRYLRAAQRADGAWIPLWFGNQGTVDQTNPVYGTSRVLSHLGACPELSEVLACGRAWLCQSQHDSGAWGGNKGVTPSLEETALAVDALASSAPNQAELAAIKGGVKWLVSQLGTSVEPIPAPIGLYFARLWYAEKLYPTVFACAALGKADLMPDA